MTDSDPRNGPFRPRFWGLEMAKNAVLGNLLKNSPKNEEI